MEEKRQVVNALLEAFKKFSLENEEEKPLRISLTTQYALTNLITDLLKKQDIDVDDIVKRLKAIYQENEIK